MMSRSPEQAGGRKTALITGATGYIGFCLCSRLTLEGWEVHALTRKSPGAGPEVSFPDGVLLHTHDGSTGCLLEIFDKIRPDTVFHLATLFITEHKPSEVDRLLESNIAFGTRIVEAMTKTGTQELINTGTTWQNYLGSGYNPVNLYAAMKEAFETVLRFYAEVRGLKVITLKLSDTYGPHDPRPKILNLLFTAALENGSLEMSPGEQAIDLVHIEDVLDGFSIAARRITTLDTGQMESFSLQSGRSISIRELAALIEAAAGKKLDITWGNRPYRTREVMKPPDAGPTLPGWSARRVLEKEIGKLWSC